MHAMPLDLFADLMAWLATPRSVLEVAEKIKRAIPTARTYLHFWREQGYVEDAGERRTGSRPAKLYIMAGVPVPVSTWLERQGPVEAPHGFFKQPGAVFDYARAIGITPPAAARHVRIWEDQGLLYPAGMKVFPHGGRPAQLYCSDAARARRSTLEYIAAEYQRWRAKHPDADLDTWEG